MEAVLFVLKAVMAKNKQTNKKPSKTHTGCFFNILTVGFVFVVFYREIELLGLLRN